MRMNRRSILAALFLTALPAVGQQKVTSVRLYVFDCGRLKSGNPAPLLERGVTTTDMSVEAFLIVHPRGTLLWDAGVIPDELVKPEGTAEARATVHTTLKGQLAAIGYKPAEGPGWNGLGNARGGGEKSELRSDRQAEAYPTKAVRALLGWTRQSLIPLARCRHYG